MQKKICLILLITIFLNHMPAMCVPTESTNEFALRLDRVIPRGGGGDDTGGESGGMNGGVVAAIALGSVAGGLGILGLLAWKTGLIFGKCLAPGQTMGEDTPIEAICLDKDKMIEKLSTSKNDYTYLLKALEKTDGKNCKEAKYIIVPDTTISLDSFNTIIFKLPQEPFTTEKKLKIKLIQASEPIQIYKHIPEIDTKLLINNSNEKISDILNKKKCLKSTEKLEDTALTSNTQSGEVTFLTKEGDANFSKSTDPNAVLITTFSTTAKKQTTKKYAFILELSAI